MRRLAIAAIAIAAAANAFSAVPLATAIITLRESRYFIGKEQQSGNDKYCVRELDHSFDYGSEVTLTAIPTNGLKIVRWRLAELDIGDLDGEGVKPLLDKEDSQDSQVTFTLASPKFKNATMDYFIALDLEYAKYDLIFNYNGGDGGVPSISGLTTTNSVTLPVPSRAGYTFVAWTNDVGRSFQAGASLTPAIDLGIGNADTNFTLTAQWTAGTMSIAYDLAQGDYGTEHPVSATYDQPFKVSAPTRTGYAFKGWTFSGVNLSTARWGTSSNPSSTMSAGSAYPSNGGDIWLKNLTPEASATVTMTATWEPATYKINYSLDGGAAGNPEYTPASAVFDSWVRIAPPTRTGYAFAGWAVTGHDTATAISMSSDLNVCRMDSTPGHPALWEDGYALVGNLTPSNGGTVVFTALWTANTYSMSYNLEGGTAGTSAPAAVAYGEVFKVSAPTRTGYDFKGWTFDNYDSSNARWGTSQDPSSTISAGWAYPPGGGDIWLKNLSANSSSVVTNTATWEAKEYTVTLSVSGANNNPTTKLTATYGQATPSVTTTPSYGNADFMGFYTQPNGQGEKYWNSDGSPCVATWTNDVDMTFYEYKGNLRKLLTFHGNGGVPVQTVTNAVVGSTYGSVMPTVSWAGGRYVFAGWFTAAAGGEEVLADAIVAEGSGDINLYAHWEVATYFVRFDGNGATNETEMAVQEIPFDAAMPLSANEYGKIGFSFAGWAASGSATVTYADCAVVSNLSSTAGETNVLTAVWTTNTYYVAFDANGGTGTMATLTNRYGKATVYPPNGFTRNEFWNFSCWSNTVSGATAAPGDELLNLTDKDGDTVVIKAVWITTLTEFSQAMHCNNLQWNLNSGNGQSWDVETGADLGYNKSGSMVSQAGLSAKSLQAVVTTNGTFKFRCRIDSGEAGKMHIWAASGNGASNVTYTSDRALNKKEIEVAASPDGSWQEISYKVETAGEPLYVNVSNWTTGNEISNKLCIDHMEWIPEGSDVPVEPGPGDEREFSTLACSGDSLFLSFPNADDRFSYVLRGTNDLVAPMPWPALFSTNGTGSITIETKILPGVPCMFYYLETTTK